MELMHLYSFRKRQPDKHLHRIIITTLFFILFFFFFPKPRKHEHVIIVEIKQFTVRKKKGDQENYLKKERKKAKTKTKN